MTDWMYSAQEGTESQNGLGESPPVVAVETKFAPVPTQAHARSAARR